MQEATDLDCYKKGRLSVKVGLFCTFVVLPNAFLFDPKLTLRNNQSVAL